MQMSTAKLLVAAVALVALVKCSQSIFTAPPGSTIRIIVNPDSIPASGGVSLITAVVTDGTGQPVPDGTVVQFFTDLGRIDPQGRTNDGIAKVNLISDGRSGEAHCQAFSGGGSIPNSGASASPGSGTSTTTAAGGATTSTDCKVTIGSNSALSIILAANPRNIARDGPRFSELTATIIDGASNPVANVPVVFRIGSADDPHFSATLESRGLPVYTDNNGAAHDRVWTSVPRDGKADEIPVSAVPVKGSGAPAPASVTVGVNF